MCQVCLKIAQNIQIKSKQKKINQLSEALVFELKFNHTISHLRVAVLVSKNIEMLSMGVDQRVNERVLPCKRLFVRNA